MLGIPLEGVFGVQDSSKTRSRRAKTHPRRPKMRIRRSKLPQDASKTAQDASKTAQERSKSAQETSRTSKMIRKWSQVGIKIDTTSGLMLKTAKIKKKEELTITTKEHHLVF